MSQIIIIKGKLLKNDRIEVEYQKNDGTESKPAECSEKHTSAPHKDLTKAFASLAIHAALVGEFISTSLIADVGKPNGDFVKNFSVSGFTVVGEDIEQGVILSARKTLKTGKTMGFNTPIIRFEDPSDDPYPFADDLKKSIDKCKDELTKYLNGKFAPDPQQNLFPEEKTEAVTTGDEVKLVGKPEAPVVDMPVKKAGSKKKA